MPSNDDDDDDDGLAAACYMIMHITYYANALQKRLLVIRANVILVSLCHIVKSLVSSVLAVQLHYLICL